MAGNRQEQFEHDVCPNCQEKTQLPMTGQYDLVVIGAGSGGLTAAQFAARLGAKVALVEKERIGGDCTWTGCVPSKALLKVAKVAHQVRAANDYGVCVEQPAVDMARVCAYVRQAIEAVYRHETPDRLAEQGIEVIIGAARFLNAHTLQVGERALWAKKFIIATGARPVIPPLPGLSAVSYLTYEQIFENDYLPQRLLVMGAGPIGAEIAQAYQRLGAQVALIDVGLLPREEPEVAQVMRRVLVREGIQFIEGLVTAVRQEGPQIIVRVKEREFQGEMLLVAVGRAPSVAGLNLEQAGVNYSAKGIPVDNQLRTNVRHIYAVGDCILDNHQFTHLAAWQGFQAARNALLPGSSRGVSQIVPWTTFTDPEVAHVGLTEAQARDKYGDKVRIVYREMDRVDRAVVENDRDGFIKVVYKKDGRLLGATIVAERAGEAITEFTLALRHSLKLVDLAEAIHVYPTYSTGVQQLAAELATDNVLDSILGKVIKTLSRYGS
jgi:pyruvate/2-oxoglutarate dehydrogenase complex dihydrolipoamide dehydrogenase (E3) component